MSNLARAAASGQLEIVRFLVEKKADVEGLRGSERPLAAAARGGHPAVVTYLLRVGANAHA